MKSATLSLLFCFFVFSSFAQADHNRLVIDSLEVYFDFAQFSLREDAKQDLAEFIPRISADTSLSFTIVAHTDSIGNQAANLRLSEKRAKSLVNYLHESGIEKERINWTYQGENKPLISNETEEGRQKNRRATLLAWKPKPKEKPLGFLKGTVLDNEGVPLKAEVSLKLSGKKPRLTTSDSLTGKFAIPFYKEELGLGILEVYAEDHFYHSQVADLYKAPSLDIKIKLNRSEVGEKMALNKLYFVGNQAVLLPQSVPELKRLLRFMQINSSTRVEIGGHVNHPFTKPEDLPRWSFDLSVNRAKVVYEYLVENGITADRMAFKGYGNEFMVFPEARAEAQMKKNRRVEVTILSDKKPQE